jgi:hypothetical protein
MNDEVIERIARETGWPAPNVRSVLTKAMLAGLAPMCSNTPMPKEKNPGFDTGLGIVVVDEPATVSIQTFALGPNPGPDPDVGVMMVFNARRGAPFSQVMIGLSPQQTLDLLRLLEQSREYMQRAVEQGHGGPGFPPPEIEKPEGQGH